MMANLILRNYVNGEWKTPSAEPIIEVKNPATDEIIGRIAPPNSQEIEETIGSAVSAFPAWRNTSAIDRSQKLFHLKYLLEDHIKELSEIITNDHGKEYPGAFGEMRRAIQMVDVACGAPSLLKGEYSEDIASGSQRQHHIDEYLIRVPLGVFTIISPFNFPIMVPLWFMPFALVCGNTCIIKPSEQTPMVMNRMFEILDQCDFPPGVINLINGGPEVGEQLITHPQIAGVSFVGSSAIAQQVYATATKSGKRAQCQGGAKNVAVILNDANLERAIPNLINASFGNAGQRCLAQPLIMVEQEISDQFHAEFMHAAKQMKVGYGLDEKVEMGPVVSQATLKRPKNEIQLGLDEGATLLLDGRQMKVEEYPRGYWLGPTIFGDVKPQMRLFKEELFGPITGIITVQNLDEAIQLINQNPYGNAATIYTETGSYARQFRYEVDAGNIGINVGVAAPMAFYPFSGMKNSFFGDLHGQGMDAIRFFTEDKIIIERWFGK